MIRSCGTGFVKALAMALGGVLALAPAAAGAAAVATNLAGARAVVDVPVGFNPLTASSTALAAAGVPPRPDAARDAAGYANWQRAVTSGAKRIMPVLRRVDMRHKPRISNGTQTTTNWSGYALVRNSVTSYGATSFYYLVTDFVVPVAQQAFGTCTGGWVYSAYWAGIDGYSNNDVLQAGTEADAYCSGGYTSSEYYAWYEWYPANEVQITNMTVSPGDDMYVEVWSGSATVGDAYIVDFTKNVSVSVEFDAPRGTALVGNSAEFIVERPEVGNSLSNLMNYVLGYWVGTQAYDFYGDPSSPGAPYAGVASDLQIMTTNNGAEISSAALFGTNMLLFYNAGTSR